MVYLLATSRVSCASTQEAILDLGSGDEFRVTRVFEMEPEFLLSKCLCLFWLILCKVLGFYVKEGSTNLKNPSIGPAASHSFCPGTP
jgi:hypothetical protein